MIKQVSFAVVATLIGYAGATFGPSAIKSLSNEKHYVVFNKKQFIKPDVPAQSRLMALAEINLNATMNQINGFSFDAAPMEVEKLKEAAGDEWEIQEERVYNIEGCTPESTPIPTPFPTWPPNPTFPPGTPNPTEPPTSGDIVPWGVEKIQAIAAQQTTKAENVLVCITDTGVDMQHPDLQGAVVGGQSFVQGVGSFQDDQGHGTHVAGTIAALANGKDVIGVSQAKLYIAKVLDRNGSGMSSWIANGIVGCVNANAKIISMSLGSPASQGPDQLIAQAIGYALSRGIAVVAAAGNDSGPVGYPAALQGVIAVGATDQFDNYASFSSRGPQIQYLAPGLNVLSLRLGGGTTTMSGTSMATPHVSGALALAIARGKTIISTDPVNVQFAGRGRINALKTVQ